MAPQFNHQANVDQANTSCPVSTDFRFTWSVCCWCVAQPLLNKQQFEMLEKKAGPEDCINWTKLVHLNSTIEETSSLFHFSPLHCSITIRVLPTFCVNATSSGLLRLFVHQLHWTDALNTKNSTIVLN
jgi:hypothetical protein